MRTDGFDMTRPGRLWRRRGVTGTVFPGLLLVIAIVLNVVIPDEFCPFVPLLVIGVPALAAATSGIIGAAIYAVLGAAVAAGLFVAEAGESIAMAQNYLRMGLFVSQIVALAVVFVASLIPGYLRSRRESAMRQLRSVSEAVQHAVLIPLPEQDGCVRTAAEYLSADDEALIGGDLYDIVDTPYGVRMIIGDVRGKGLPAVTSANALLGAFRAVAPTARTLPELAERLDDIVHRHKRRAGLDLEEFTTATFVSTNEDEGAEMLCCGHPGPLLIRAADGTVTQTSASEPWPPLGLGYLATQPPRTDPIPFETGDRLLLYTDGVTDSFDPAGAGDPLRERVEIWADAGPKQLVEQLVADLGDYTHGRFTDDAAILAIQRIARRSPAMDVSPDPTVPP